MYELEQENAQLKRLVAELRLDRAIVKGILQSSFAFRHQTFLRLGCFLSTIEGGFDDGGFCSFRSVSRMALLIWPLDQNKIVWRGLSIILG